MMVFGEIFWTAKDFSKTPEVDADAGETQPGFKMTAYDAFTKALMFL